MEVCDGDRGSVGWWWFTVYLHPDDAGVFRLFCSAVSVAPAMQHRKLSSIWNASAVLPAPSLDTVLTQILEG